MKGKRKKELELDNEKLRIALWLSAIDKSAALLTTATIGGVVVWVFSLMRDALVAFAGAETQVVGLLRAVVDLNINEWLAYSIAALTTGGYVREKKAKTRTIRSLAPYARKYEEAIDPHRSSSGLNRDGQPTKGARDAA